MCKHKPLTISHTLYYSETIEKRFTITRREYSDRWTRKRYTPGGKGNDLLEGVDGRDFLVGGPGTNVMSGGNGADQFYYARMPETDVGPVINMRSDKFISTRPSLEFRDRI